MNKAKFIKGMLAGLLVGAVGGYFLHKKKGKLMRKVWMIRAKAEIYRRLGNLKEVTKENFRDVVDSVLDKYRASKEIAEEEVERLAKAMMRKWKDMRDEINEKTAEMEEASEDDDEDEDEN